MFLTSAVNLARIALTLSSTSYIPHGNEGTPEEMRCGNSGAGAVVSFETAKQLVAQR